MEMSLDQVCSEYADRIRRWVRNFEYSRPIAARLIDCESEGWLAAILAYESFDPDKNGDFQKYLFNRVRFHLLDLYRTYARKQRLMEGYLAGTKCARHRPAHVDPLTLLSDAKLDNPDGFRNIKQARKYVNP